MATSLSTGFPPKSSQQFQIFHLKDEMATRALNENGKITLKRPFSEKKRFWLIPPFYNSRMGVENFDFSKISSLQYQNVTERIILIFQE